MGFKPGVPRPENAGRKKGTPNKDTTHLFEIAQRLDCDPFEILLHFAKRNYKELGLTEYKVRQSKEGDSVVELTISPELQQKSAKDACDFMYPKRKAIEMSAGGSGEFLSLEDFLKAKKQNEDKKNEKDDVSYPDPDEL